MCRNYSHLASPTFARIARTPLVAYSIAMSIYQLRRDYTGEPLGRGNVDADPYAQFERWYTQAVEAEVSDPNAMTLATASADARPSSRVVLLKGASPETGFVFYTDYTSRKARELTENPHAALSFYWAELSRQVRIEGLVGKLEHAESEAYFRGRPREAQLAAWASRQSRSLESREALEARVTDLAAEYEGEEVPLPPHWGGFRIGPAAFEFWQGRPGRLHDRIVYRLPGDAGDAGGAVGAGGAGGAIGAVGEWMIERLSP